MKWFMNLVFTHILYRTKYTNLDKLNKFDKCLICPNHSDMFDACFIYAKTDNLSIMAKAELFKIPVLNLLIKAFGAFPVHRGENDINALKQSIKILKNKS